MIYPHVKRLFLFRPPNDNTKKIFQDKCLWSAKPEHFNDPFDCDLEVGKKITEEDVMQAVNARYGDRKTWSSEVRQHIDEMIGIDGKFSPWHTNALIAKLSNS